MSEVPNRIEFPRYESRGRASDVEIVKEEYLGEGRFGVVTSADVLIKGRPRKFVIKRFHGDDFDQWEKATYAKDMYEDFRELKFPVFSTFRLDKK